MAKNELEQNPWLPPSPHREKVLEILRNGRAHLVAQGHGKPPLLISEDGGAMDLSEFRWVDGQGIAERSEEPAAPTTRYLDVCGTIDELERLLKEDPGIVSRDPAVLNRLLDEALAMIDRMFVRWDEYQGFTREIRDRVVAMESLKPPRQPVALENAAALRTAFRERPEHVKDDLDRLFEQAEAVRTVAGDLEKVLYRLRDDAIEIEALYEQVRGAREWKK